MNVELTIPVEKLRKGSIFVATPMYGGMCSGGFCKSATELMNRCDTYGLRLQFFFISNESLIQRARNYLVDEFLRSDYTHLMFIDSDITFNPDDVLSMLTLSLLKKEEMNVICGPYPKKCISWEKIARAVNKGYADDNPQQLERFVGDYVFNPTQGQTHINVGQPVEVLEGGTGFMMIPRQTFEKFDSAYPELRYKPDHIRTEHFDGSREIMAYFHVVIDDTRRLLSEDYMFCQYARKIGMKVWLCPWMRLQHTGTFTFGGSLVDLAMIGAAATADPAAIGKGRHLTGR